MSNPPKDKKKKKPAPPKPNPDPSAAPPSQPAASTSADRGSTWRDEVRDGVILGLNFVKDVSESTDVLGPLKIASAVLIRGLETAKAIKKNKEAWSELIEELEDQYDGLQRHINQVDDKQTMTDSLRPVLITYLRSLEKILDRAQKAQTYSEMSVIRRLGRTQIDVEEIQSLTKSTDRAYKRFMEATSTLILHQITGVALDIKEMRVEIKEQFSGYQSSKSPEADARLSEDFFRLVYGVNLEVCQKGTRVAILDRIRAWAKDTETSKRIFWLNDTAGAGKTTIASTMAREWLRDSQLAGRFFFTPNSKLASGISEFCHIVARDIAILLPNLAPVINKAIASTPSTNFHFEEALHRLIVAPLKAYKETVMFVIDALDNCDAVDRKTLLDIVIPTSANVKILITSRPEPDIQDTIDMCEEVDGLDVHLHDPEDADLQADIALYVNKNLSNLSPQQKETIVTHSDSLFIWVSTVCHQLRNSRRPTEAIQRILDPTKGSRLDTLYFEVLNHALVDRTALHLILNVLQVIMAALEPISITTLRTFLPANDQIEIIIKDLASVLRTNNLTEPIQVIHSTFRDFLSHKDRAGPFFVDSEASHEALAVICLDLLQDCLIYDFFQLALSGRRIPRDIYFLTLEHKVKARLTADIAYASAHWIYHVVKAVQCDGVLQKTRQFLFNKLLNWVELMGWLGQGSQCVSALSLLSTSVRNHGLQPASTSDEDMFFQAYQFVQCNQALLRGAPLHIYHSALAFAPTNVPLFDNYKSQHKSLATYVMDTSARHTKATLLVGHQRWILSMTFSPDSMRLLTISNDRTARLWDTVSGHDIAGPMRTDSSDSLPSCAAFSSEGTKLVLGYTRGSISLRDGLTGTLKDHAHIPYSDRVSILTFLPNNSLFASAYLVGKAIRFWNVSSDKLTQSGKDLLHDERINCFSISPSGNTIVSSSGNGKIIQWDPSTFEKLYEFISPENQPIVSLMFIPNADFFVTASTSGTVRCWYGPSGTTELLTEGKSEESKSSPAIFCSPNGMYIATNIDRLSLWRKNEAKFVEIQLIDAQSSNQVVSFSKDSTMLGSISGTSQFRIWSAETGRVIHTLEMEQNYSSNKYAISQDLSRIAVSDEATIIKLYETAANIGVDTNHNTTTIPSGTLELIELFPNGQIVVSASSHFSLQLWNAKTGEPIGEEMKGHADNVSSISVSPDGRLIASGSFDGGVKLWKSTNGESQRLDSSEGEIDSIVMVDFSPNGESLVAGWSSSGMVHVWSVNIEGETKLSIRLTFSGELSALAFSNDSNLVICALLRQLQIRRISDGSTICSIQHFYSRPDLVALSPQGDRIAMVYADHSSIAIWDIQRGPHPIAHINIDDPCPGASLSISSQGYLVYGSNVWQIKPVNPRPVNEWTLPEELRSSTESPRSLLSYLDGWIHSAVVGGHLIATPTHLGVSPRARWSARGDLIAFATSTGKPLIVDCSPMLE